MDFLSCSFFYFFIYIDFGNALREL